MRLLGITLLAVGIIKGAQGQTCSADFNDSGNAPDPSNNWDGTSMKAWDGCDDCASNCGFTTFVKDDGGPGDTYCICYDPSHSISGTFNNPGNLFEPSCQQFYDAGNTCATPYANASTRFCSYGQGCDLDYCCDSSTTEGAPPTGGGGPGDGSSGPSVSNLCSEVPAPTGSTKDYACAARHNSSSWVFSDQGNYCTSNINCDPTNEYADPATENSGCCVNTNSSSGSGGGSGSGGDPTCEANPEYDCGNYGKVYASDHCNSTIESGFTFESWCCQPSCSYIFGGDGCGGGDSCSSSGGSGGGSGGSGPTCEANPEYDCGNYGKVYAADHCNTTIESGFTFESWCCQPAGSNTFGGDGCGGGSGGDSGGGSSSGDPPGSGGGGPPGAGGGGGSGSAADGDSCSSDGDCATGLECLEQKGCVPAAMKSAVDAVDSSALQNSAQNVSFAGHFTGKSSAAKAALRRTIVNALKGKNSIGAENNGIRVPFTDFALDAGAGKTFIENLLNSRGKTEVTMRAPKNKGAPGISAALDKPGDCVKADFTEADTEVIECVHVEDGDKCLRCDNNVPISLTTYSSGSYTYQCHDGSTWDSPISISVGDTYNCTIGGNVYESAIFSETGGGGSGGTANGGTCSADGDCASNDCDNGVCVCIEVGQRVLMDDGTHKNIEHLQPGDVLRTPTGRTTVRSTRRGGRHLSAVHDVSCNGMTGAITGNHAYHCDGEWRLPQDTHNPRALTGTTEVVAVETDNYCEDRMILESGLHVETWDGRGIDEWRPHSYENGRRLRCTLKGSWRDRVLQRVDSKE
jgi:hypothetical protein